MAKAKATTGASCDEYAEFLVRKSQLDGRLVETVMPPSGRNLTISHNEEGGASAFCVGKHGTGPTPLDALRALAAKLGMTDEKGATR